jgi:hypothetical protein
MFRISQVWLPRELSIESRHSPIAMGYPIRKPFQKKEENPEVLSKIRFDLKIPDDLKVVLYSMGGIAVMEELFLSDISELLESPTPLHLIAITGKNENLRNILQAKFPDKLHLPGYLEVEEMARYLQIFVYYKVNTLLFINCKFV